MGTYNGTLKKWNATGAVWDELLPKTTAENIISGTLHLDRIPVMNASKIPPLDASKITTGTIDAALLPAIALTNVVTYTTLSAFATAYNANHNLVQTGDVVVLTTDKKTYVHNGGTTWTPTDLTLLETPTDVVTSVAGKTGVVTLVKGDVGLGNVDNTSDANKPVSTAQQAALNLKANLASPTFTGTVSGITKAMVGLGNVDNTSDANKPVSTAQQTALNLKLDKAGGAISGLLTLNGNVSSDNGSISFTGLDSLSFGQALLTDVADPISDQNAATKKYVDGKDMLILDTIPTTGAFDGQLVFEY